MQEEVVATTATPTKVQPVLAVTVQVSPESVLMIEKSNELLTFMLEKAASKSVPKGTVRAPAVPLKVIRPFAN